MTYRAFLMTTMSSLMMALLMPSISTGSELVIYDGDLETAKSVMSAEVDTAGGRDFRMFSSYKFPGTEDLWVAGAESVAGCNQDIAGEFLNQTFEDLLIKAADVVDQLDTERASAMMEELANALPCVRDTVFPEQIGRLFFLRGILSDFVGGDAKETESAFQDALSVYDMDWSDQYSPVTGAKFFKMKNIVASRRDSKSSYQIHLDYRFPHDDLTVDGRRAVTQILPGTHLLQWYVQGAWHGRVFTVPDTGVKNIVFASEKAWHDVVLNGPKIENSSDMRIVRAYFDKTAGVSRVYVLSLTKEVPTGYAYFLNAVIDPVTIMAIATKVLPKVKEASTKVVPKVKETSTKTPDPTPREKHVVTGNVGAFGTYALLATSNYAGFAVLGHVNLVGNFEVGAGGHVLFARYNKADYVLPGVVFGARYFFTRNSVVHPFAGVYVPVEFQKLAVIASVQGCLGIELGFPVMPTVAVCGGVASPGVGRAQLMLGASFK